MTGKKQSQQTWIILAVAIIVGAYLVSTNLKLNIQLPGNVINLPGAQTPAPQGNTTIVMPANNLAPTSLYVTLQPNPVRMGQYVYGNVVSNGYNYPITAYVLLKGPGTTQSFGGLLDAQGFFQMIQQVNIPGFYEVYVATSGGVTSNTAYLTVEGVYLHASATTYSKSFADSITLEVYSNMHGNAAIIANDPAHSVSYPVTNCAVNSNGYGSVAPSLDFLANGSYELDVVLGGQKASDFSGSWWVSVGR